MVSPKCMKANRFLEVQPGVETTLTAGEEKRSENVEEGKEK